MTPDAAFFDMDGLLVDSEPLWFEVEQAVMARLDGPWTPADQAACLGGSMANTARYMLARSTRQPSEAEVEVMLTDTMAGLLARDVPVRPGALELLAALDAAGVPCALVSSSPRRLIDAALAGLAGRGAEAFAFSIGGDEISRPKPAPDAYLLAAERFGVDPARCVVFEDSPTGAAAAGAAGCVCIAVPSETPVPPAPRRQVVASLADVGVEDVVAAMAAHA